MLTLFPFPPYHEFRDGRFHTDEGSHFATVEVMNNRKRAIIVTMGDKGKCWLIPAQTCIVWYVVILFVKPQMGYIISYIP